MEYELKFNNKIILEYETNGLNKDKISEATLYEGQAITTSYEEQIGKNSTDDFFKIREFWESKVQIAEAHTASGIIYYLVDENLDFIPYFKEFFSMIEASHRKTPSPNTFRSYCNKLWYIVVYLKIKKLNILDLDGRPDILADFKSWLKNPYRFYENVKTLSPYHEYEDCDLCENTINQIVYRVSSFYNWMTATKRIKESPVIYSNYIVSENSRDSDPLSHTRRSKIRRRNSLKSQVPKTIPKTINDKDFKKLLDSANLLRDKIILITLKESGVRLSELLGIHIEDIDFAEQGVWIKFRPDNINKSRAKAGYGRDRFVDLPVDLMTLIDSFINTDWINANPVYDFLFIVTNSNRQSDNGYPMKPSTINSMLKHHCIKAFGYHIEDGKKLPLKNINAHKFRHTHATNLAQNYLNRNEKIDWEFISIRLGHSSVYITRKIYIHLEKRDLKKEYNRLHSKKEDSTNNV